MRLLCRDLTRDPQLTVRLLTRKDSELARRARLDGVTVEEVPWTIGLDPRAWWRIYLACARFRPDIVHAHDSHALALARAGRGRGDVGDTGSWLIATRRVDFHVRPRSAWRRVHRVIAISEAVKGILTADGFSPHDITVVPSGIDPDEVRSAARADLNIRARLGLEPGTPLAVNVAALVDHKDQRTLIHAAARARATNPDLHWAIAGEGELRRSLAREIAALDLADRVHLLGYIEEADALIREADVFVMSSKEEGLGSVVLNALALDKPVVATRGGGLPEILPPEALVPVGDAGALARHVAAALADPVRVPLPERFTARAMAAGVLAVYRALA